MNIRFAKSTDNKKQIAKLLYETDGFIYPYCFQSKEEGIEILSDLIGTENSIFHYKNCIIAEKDDEIVGLLLFFTDKTNFSYDYKKYLNKSFELDYTITNYFKKVENELPPNTAYIFGVRVAESFLHQHIAENMFMFLFMHLPLGIETKLNVLAENTPAINLYTKLGFKIISTQNGFNGYRKRKPLCYSMKK